MEQEKLSTSPSQSTTEAMTRANRFRKEYMKALENYSFGY